MYNIKQKMLGHSKQVVSQSSPDRSQILCCSLGKMYEDEYLNFKNDIARA